jgi:hypothetical protein
MDIRPTELPIVQPRESDAVRRVDAASDRQGRREHAERDTGEHEAGAGGESPHDVVDLSEQYQPHTSAAPSASEVESGSGLAAESVGVRHLDLEA